MHLTRHSTAEEAANALIHRLGYLLSAVALGFFVVQAAGVGAGALCGALLFGSSLTAVFFVSSSYHACSVELKPDRKERLRKLDHAAIYLLIASTHVACMLLMRDVALNLPLLCLIITLSIFGIVITLREAVNFESISLVLYLTLGWLGVFVFGFNRLFSPDLKVGLIMGGGLVYTAGVVFYLKDRIPYFHAVWHTFVLAAAGLHYAAFFVAVSEYG